MGFFLQLSGSKATPGPQTSAHRLTNKTCAENYEIPAITKGKVVLRWMSCVNRYVIDVLTGRFSFLINADVFVPLSLTEPRFVSNAIWLFSNIQIIIKIAVDGLGRNLFFLLTLKDQTFRPWKCLKFVPVSREREKELPTVFRCKRDTNCWDLWQLQLHLQSF